MPYVSALLTTGRVGHQFSQLFTARYFAFAYQFDYLHADFIDGNKWGEKAANWNNFFQLGQRVPHIKDYVHDRPAIQVTRPLPPRPDTPKFQWEAAHFHAISQGVPADWLLLFPDYGLIWYNAYDWSKITFSNTAAWFQQQVASSHMYRQCPVVKSSCPAELSVVGYLRRSGGVEKLPPAWYVSEDRFLSALTALKQRYGTKMSRPVVFTQGPHKELVHPDWKDVDIRICNDEYPAVFHAVKTCVEADVFVGSAGATNALIRTLRHNQRVSLGIAEKHVRADYPDGPHITDDQKIVKKVGELWLP